MSAWTVALPALLVACASEDTARQPEHASGGEFSTVTLQLDDGTEVIRSVFLGVFDVEGRADDTGSCGAGVELATWTTESLHLGDPTFVAWDVGAASRVEDRFLVTWNRDSPSDDTPTHQWRGTYTVEEWGEDVRVLGMSEGEVCPAGEDLECTPASGSITIEGPPQAAAAQTGGQPVWIDVSSGSPLCTGSGTTAD